MSINPLDVLANRVRVRARARRADRLRRAALDRPFSPDAQSRLLLITEPERIPQSQIFPFHHYAADFARLYGAEIREADLWDVLAGHPIAASGATVVGFQTPFDIADADLNRLMTRIREAAPQARIACLDWFAPTDLRNAARFDPWVDLYVKKHLLRDRGRYGQPTLGDTNLTDFYARRFALDEAPTTHAIPAGFMEKLVLGPSFATAPLILPMLTGRAPKTAVRPIDLHARFAVGGTPWYQGMRAEAEAALAPLADLTVAREGSVPLPRFMVEMAHSKLCFSPFGYGEVCWRDYEAVAGGAVLLKPDMKHIETAPDIFVPWETYVPLRWDLADFEETTRRLLADPALRSRIAFQAHATLKAWLTSDAFVRAMAPLFAQARANPAR